MIGLRVLILFHSRSGNTFRLAQAVAEGARGVPGAKVEIRRVAELTDEAQLLNHHFIGPAFSEIREIPVAGPGDLADFDVIIMGSPTRFGSMSAEMKHFIDALGQVWREGRLQDKVGAAFTSASTLHGGHEITLIGFLTTMMHLGMIVVTPGYVEAINDIAGAPYGATATTKPSGTRMAPTENDLAAAVTLGRRVASIGHRLKQSAAETAARVLPGARPGPK